MTTGSHERGRQGIFSKKFTDVMSARNIDDITLKMQAIQNVPQDTLVRTFVEMCDAGVNIYIREQKKRYPCKSDREIMRKYHHERIRTDEPVQETRRACHEAEIREKDRD